MPTRLKRYVVIGFVSVVVMTAVVTVLLLVPGKEVPENTSDIDLFSIGTESVNRFIINTEEGRRIELHKKDGAWRFADTDAPTDFQRAHLTATYLSYMFADRLVEKESSNLSRYGLETPKSSAEFFMDDGSSHKIEFGSETADKKSVYMKMDEKNTIYTIDKVSHSIIMWKD